MKLPVHLNATAMNYEWSREEDEKYCAASTMLSRLPRNASVGVDGYILVYSITSRNSFDRINQISESLLSALGDAIDIPRVLVGSMLDLSDQRQVTFRVSATITIIV